MLTCTLIDRLSLGSTAVPPCARTKRFPSFEGRQGTRARIDL